jgi:DNA-binding transcriptional LysR family regulator
MQLHHLRYFVVLADELHFGRAAQRLSITQPPLSYAIQTLEKDLGILLFERDSKRVNLTPAGEAYLVEVRSILDRIAHANDTARAVAGGKIGRLDIGFTGSMVYRDVPQIVSRFFAQHPGIEVTLRELSSVEQIEGLRHGQLHAGFVNALSVPEGLAGEALQDDGFVCCLPEHHALARETEIDLIQLSREPFVMFARDVAPANYDNVIGICMQAGFAPQTCYAARQWLTIVALVANGLGVALVPASIQRTRIAGARFVPLRARNAHSKAYLLWHPESRMPALTYFIDAARAILRSHTGKRRPARAPLKRSS